MNRPFSQAQVASDIVTAINDEELRRARDTLREKERTLTTLMGNLEGMVYRCRDDAHWTMEFVSEGCERLTGYPRRDLLFNGRISYEKLTHAEDRDRVRTEIHAALRAGKRFSSEYRIATADGGLKWVWETGVGIRDERGALVALEGYIQDVSQRKAAEQALRQAEERYRDIFEHAIEGIFQSTQDGRYLGANPALARMYGYATPADLIENLSDITRQLYVNPERRREFAAEMARDGSVKNFVSQVRRRDGSIIWIAENARAVRGEDGEVLYYEGSVEDITDSRLYQQRLEHQATHDALTSLPNRLLLNDRLRHALSYAERYELPVAVIFIDLDHFKLINDSLGHEAGDRLLKAMAERMRECVRGSDTVARQSGDEFVVLLRGEKGEDGVTEVVQRIVRRVCLPWREAGQEIGVTCSIGISLYPRDGDDAVALLRNADAAMYRSKELGRNQFQYFTPELNVVARSRLDLQTRLRRALDRQEFILHYQPKIDLARGSVAGMEALVRWHPADGPVAGPGEFIPAAEESGLIVPLGEWVIQEACACARRMHAAGFGDLQVAVNLSARQFHRRDFLSSVQRIVGASGLPSRFVEFELTENLMMHDAEYCVATVAALDRLGMSFAVDDFGTGYSNLAYLKRFPVTRLKIDRAFVREVADNANDAAIVRAVISLAHNLGMRVVAEGVETRRQLEFLTANRCDEIQGYLFSRPLPEPAFLSFLRAPIAGFERQG